MKYTSAILLGLFATTVVASPHGGYDGGYYGGGGKGKGDFDDNKYCKAKTITKTNWNAKTTVTKVSTKYSTKLAVKTKISTKYSVVTRTKYSTKTSCKKKPDFPPV